MRLAKIFSNFDEQGVKNLLSNSDPKNENPKKSFFDDLYGEYYIERVPTSRIINCHEDRRGKVNKLIITNYHVKKIS